LGCNTSKYSVVSELVRIANTLDESGFVREASAIDKVAKKIVTSSVDETTYKKDIENYKELISKAYFEKDPTKKQQLLQQATNQYNGVLNSMWSRYDPQQKQSFQAQTVRIRQEYNIGQYAADANFPQVEKLEPYLKEYETFLTQLKDSEKDSKIISTKEIQFIKEMFKKLQSQKLLTPINRDYFDRTRTMLLSSIDYAVEPDKPSWDF
jgi:hypothetical protein